jgi:hypothetical protein
MITSRSNKYLISSKATPLVSGRQKYVQTAMNKQQKPKIKNVPNPMLLSIIGVNLEMVNAKSQFTATAMERAAGRTWFGATSPATTHLNTKRKEKVRDGLHGNGKCLR